MITIQASTLNAAALLVGVVFVGLLYGMLMSSIRAHKADNRAALAEARLSLQHDLDHVARTAHGVKPLDAPAPRPAAVGTLSGDVTYVDLTDATVELARYREPTLAELTAWQTGGMR